MILLSARDLLWIQFLVQCRSRLKCQYFGDIYCLQLQDKMTTKWVLLIHMSTGPHVSQ